LEFFELPPEIDLSSANFSDQYNDVLVHLEFQRFASVIPEFYGEPIQYALTIPANAPHPDAAVLFIEFLLSAEGQQVMSQAHQPLLLPVEIDNPENIPTELKTLLGI
jgi:molybdate/tungstate transport system substrate-binding protein